MDTRDEPCFLFASKLDVTLLSASGAAARAGGMQAPHTASAAAARNVAPLPTTTSAAEAFAKIVWRQAPVPAASGDPRDVLQRTFASLQVRFADELSLIHI